MFAKLKKIERKVLIVGASLVLVGLSGCGNDGPVETRSLGAATTTSYKYSSGKTTKRRMAIEVHGTDGAVEEEESAADRVRRLEEEEKNLKRARALEKLSVEDRKLLGVVEKN